jgi:membrane associated rhomboid family serine protease
MRETINIQIKKKIIFFIIMLCSIYTVLTLLSSAIQLMNGIISDTNLHIILRFVICFIGISFWMTFSIIKLKKQWMTIIFQYVFSMSFIFALIFILGYFVELADSAYLDIFLNYTIPFIIISTLMSINKERKIKKKNLK